MIYKVDPYKVDPPLLNICDIDRKEEVSDGY